MWDSIVRETVEETGIPRDKLLEGEGAFYCTGVVERLPDHRPDINFYVPLKRTKADIYDYYATAEDKYESLGIIWYPSEELKTANGRKNFFAKHKLPGCHIGSLELYLRFKKEVEGDNVGD